MLEQLDLDEVAEAYLSVRPDDQPEYERLLIRAGANAVFPLLRGVIAEAQRKKRHTKQPKSSVGRSENKKQAAKVVWASVILKPVAESAYDVVHRIGKPAKGELLRALLESDYKMRLAASVLLCMDESPDEDVINKAEALLHIIHVGSDLRQRTLTWLLLVVLARAGDAKARMLIEDQAREINLSFGEGVERLVATALIQMQAD